jgi:hypothetical protein
MQMEHLELLHKVNIFTHIATGSAALLIGVFILLTRKGSPLHIRLGRIFIYLLTAVIFTALVGVFVYGRNTFLLVITILSGYQGFSGWRNLKTKSNQFHWIDAIAILISLVTVSYYLYYMKKIGFIWSPVIIYSTVGTLILFITYDVFRYFIPKSRYQNLWLYEHIIKMVGAFTALLAAFSGTVFVTYQPISQILPSVIGFVLQIGFVIYYVKKSHINFG